MFPMFLPHSASSPKPVQPYSGLCREQRRASGYPSRPAGPASTEGAAHRGGEPCGRRVHPHTGMAGGRRGGRPHRAPSFRFPATAGLPAPPHSPGPPSPAPHSESRQASRPHATEGGGGGGAEWEDGAHPAPGNGHHRTPHGGGRPQGGAGEREAITGTPPPGGYLHRSSKTLLGISALLVSMEKHGSSRRGGARTTVLQRRGVGEAELLGARPAGSGAGRRRRGSRLRQSPRAGGSRA